MIRRFVCYKAPIVKFYCAGILECNFFCGENEKDTKMATEFNKSKFSLQVGHYYDWIASAWEILCVRVD